MTRVDGRPAGTGSPAPKRGRLAALAGTLAGLPAMASAHLNRLPDAGRPLLPPAPRAAFVAAPRLPWLAESCRPRPGALFADAGGPGRGAGDEGNGVEKYDDFGGQWLGGVPEAGQGDPGALLASFRNARDGAFSELALEAYGHAQDIGKGLAELAGASPLQPGYRSRLNALGAQGVALVRLLAAAPAEVQQLPALSAVEPAALSRLDGLLRAAGEGRDREAFLRRVAQACVEAGEIGHLDSVAGAMLAQLSESLLREVRASVAGDAGTALAASASLRDAFVAVLDRYQGMLVKNAALQALAGHPAQAAALLQQCLDAVPAARRMLRPDAPSADHVALHHELLKAQIQAGDDEAVGTLETLYMVMRAHAEEEPQRFPADFPPAAFIDRLDGAYDRFLDELDADRLQPSLEHPISRLFVEAERRGVFDDPEPKRQGDAGEPGR